MKIEGKLRVSAKPEQCLAKLRDPLWLGKCLPNLSALEKKSDREFRAVFYLDLAEIARVTGYLSRIRVDMRFTYEEATPEEVRLSGTGRVVGTRISITINARVLHDGDDSMLEWMADVDLGIIQRLLGEETVKKIAERQVGLLTNCLRDALSTGL